MNKITIAIYYNGKFPRFHQVTPAFLENLERFISAHPKFDCVIVRVDY